MLNHYNDYFQLNLNFSFDIIKVKKNDYTYYVLFMFPNRHDEANRVTICLCPILYNQFPVFGVDLYFGVLLNGQKIIN